MTDKDRARLGYGVRQAAKLTDPTALALIRQKEAEQRTLAVADQLTEARQALKTSAHVNESLTYGRNSHDGHGESYFADLLRVATLRSYNMNATQARLAQHEKEMRVEVPLRREARQRAADKAYEAAMSNGRAETRALQRMDRLGVSRFEKRAISRTDGQGGYVGGVPPLWLVEEYVNAPRPGRPFADLWHSMPLPTGTDSINIPVMQVGTGTGAQSDLGPAPVRDVTDNFAQARVVTVAGINPASMQWCEQSAPPGADEIVFRDMMEDADSQIDAQLLLGSNSPYLNGVWPGGSIAQATGCVLANSNNAAGDPQTWVCDGSGPTSTAACLYTTVAQAISLVNRARGLAPTHVVVPSWLWWSLCGTIDFNGRPLVQPGHAPEPTTDSGAAGTAWSLPVIQDDSIPVTFGSNPPPSLGGVTPALSAISKGGGSYSPILIVRAPDLYLWEGEVVTEVFQQTLAGSGQWLFRARQYAASTASRYIAQTAISVSSTYASGGVSAGGAIAYGTVTQFQTNSITSLSGQGY